MSRSLEQLGDPSWTDVLNRLKLNLSAEINCIQIGSIQTFDAVTQSASVQLLLKKVVEVQADGTRVFQERPILLDVPVMVLFGGNSFLSMPIAAGDNCIVLFNDREINQWYEKGGVQVPLTYRTHDLSDAIAIVGIRSLQNSIADYLADGVRLSYSAASRISLTEDQIESIAALFKQNGDMEITGDLLVDGNTHIKGGLQVDGVSTGSGGGAFIMGADIDLNGNDIAGGIVSSSNGATGMYTNSVTVVNGIVTGGS